MARPDILLWLPDGFLTLIQNAAKADADVEVREGIDMNCIDALQDQISIRGPVNLRDNCRMIGDIVVPQRMRQFTITLQNGITPDRLRWIVERLSAELNLLDHIDWTENAAALAAVMEGRSIVSFKRCPSEPSRMVCANWTIAVCVCCCVCARAATADARTVIGSDGGPGGGPGGDTN